jgi:drug/metabolite transporter (DMT)-like permease
MSRRQGIWFALGAAVLFGASAPAAKALLADHVGPQLLAGLLYLGSGVGLALVTSVQRAMGARSEARLVKTDAPWLMGAIFFGGVLGPVLLMVGLLRTPASSAALLLNGEGVFTALIAWIVFRENVDRRVALGMLAIVVGGLVLSSQGQSQWRGALGPIAIVAACFAWGVDNNLTQKVSSADPVQITMLKGLAAGSVNVIIALLLGARWPARDQLATAIVLGFASYGISLVLFVFALRQLGTARTGAYFSIAPFVGAAISIVAWHERPSPTFWTGAAFMAVGVWLHVSERHEHRHVHDAMEHAHAHVHDEHHQHAHAPDDPPGEPHSHPHRHERLVHSHHHYPDIHHRHSHE